MSYSSLSVSFSNAASPTALHTLSLHDALPIYTGNKSQPMGGGLALETPFGKIYSTNISPDADTGMGKYSFEQFDRADRKSTRLNSSHLGISYAVFCLKKKKKHNEQNERQQKEE